MARRRAIIAAVTLAVLGAAGSASAHGPCRCTWPAVAEPGQTVRTAGGYKVIWNPRPRDFRDQTTPEDLASGFRADAPTAVVVQRPRGRPLRRAAFRVPRGTPPGIYFVLVFDGSEGGAHTTWDLVQVPGRPPPPATPAAATGGGGGGVPIALSAGAAAVLLLAGLAVVHRRRASRDAQRQLSLPE